MLRSPGKQATQQEGGVHGGLKRHRLALLDGDSPALGSRPGGVARGHLPGRPVVRGADPALCMADGKFDVTAGAGPHRLPRDAYRRPVGAAAGDPRMQFVGTSARMLVGYCLLARTLSLMPWNRHEPISPELLRRTLFSMSVNMRCGGEATYGTGR